MSRPLFALLLPAAVVACVPAAPPPAAPRPVPHAAAPAPRPRPPAPDWHDRPATPGTWSYRQDARGSLALFGEPGQDALVTLRCDRAGRVMYLSRAGAATAPFVIRTTTATRQLLTQPTGAVPPYTATALSPGDPLLDAMGFSRGRFALEQAGLPPLALPAWPEVERVVQDCRS